MSRSGRRKRERLTTVAWTLIVMFWTLFYCVFVILVWPGVN